MSDVSALFAKKRSGKTKKSNVVSMDAVGEVLERKARRQEVQAAEAEADKGRNAAHDEYSFLKNQEESEWIETYEDGEHGRLEGLKIKDMGAESSEEDEEEEQPVQKPVPVEQQHKGWGATTKKPEDDDEEAATQSEVPRGPPARAGRGYVPPSMRGGGRAQAANIDISNEEMFPTIGAAVEIEKHNKEEKKNPWGKVESSGSSSSRGANTYQVGGRTDMTASMAAGKNDAIAAVRAMAQASGPVVPRQPRPEPAEPAAPAAPKGNAYVPPHLRNRN
ncbi:unnamed protein product, partial [Mesorhabditis spiculigera]